jgi:phosphate:Na+ symporter
MSDALLQVAGGLGLFLFGMAIMTDGLRGLAGDLLHRTLSRCTRSAATGALSGALVTAVLQSSSATTVAAVGFVSAGLLTFVQALGVVFGANLGTTVTGWLVAVLGLKFSIGSLSLPLVLLGALARVFGHGRLASGGTALAGFGLIFLGIDFLQQGMAAYQGVVTPETFPDDTLHGRLLLVLMGVAITLVTQSSSAGVATALTAVYTGTIDFPQAAALVIGMDVGTTVTAALATLGGSVDARRTGYSHVIYNLLTACGALLLLTPYTLAWEWLAPGALGQHAELALVGFHTLFNILGILLVLPFAPAFASLMTRLVRARDGAAGGQPDRLLLREPAVALDAGVRQVRVLVADTLRVVGSLLEQPERRDAVQLQRVGGAVDRLQAFVDGIHLLPEQVGDWRRLNALIHLLDHLQRLLDRCEEEPERVAMLAGVAALQDAAVNMQEMIDQVQAELAAAEWHTAQHTTRQFHQSLERQAETLRSAIMADMASGRLDIQEGTGHLEAVRWLRRGAAHFARIFAHLRELN